MKTIIEKIQKYAIEKYDDYDRRDKLSLKERMANEHARYVLDDLVTALKAMTVDAKIEADKAETVPQFVADDAKIDLAGEKEKADVGIIRNGEVPAEAVHAGRSGSTKEVPEIHTGLSATGSTEKSRS